MDGKPVELSDRLLAYSVHSTEEKYVPAGYVRLHSGLYKADREKAFRFMSADFFAKLVCLLCFLVFLATNIRPVVDGDHPENGYTDG